MMATTEMDSSESRSEQGSLDPDSNYPLKVLYCGGTVQTFIPFGVVRALV